MAEIAAPNIKTSKNDSAVRLSRAMQSAQKKIAPFQEKRIEQVRQFAGRNHGANKGARDLLNLPLSLVTTLLPHLTLEPRAMIVPVFPERASFADKFELTLNRRLSHMDIGTSFRLAIIDSMFGPGILKTGLGESEAGEFREAENYRHDPGRPFCDRVDFDDYLVDMDAKSRASVQFEGDKFSIPYEYAQDCGLYNKKVLDLLNPNNRAVKQNEKASDTGKGDAGADNERFIPELPLWSVWLPRQKMIVVVSADPDGGPKGYLREVQWEGDESGPYDLINLVDFPGQIIPISLVGSVLDLHRAANAVGRKMINQATRQKSLTVYDKVAEADAETVRDSSDGDVVGVNSVDRIKVLDQGGVADTNYKAMGWILEQFNQRSGNMDIVGGLQAGSKTLGQDQMMLQAAGGRVSDWRGQCRKACKSVLRKIAGYLWSDPVYRTKLTLDVGGVAVPTEWTPDDREGEFESDYDIDIVPYGFQNDSPAERYQRMERLISNTIVPMIPILAAQGQRIDAKRLIDFAVKSADLAELRNLFSPAAPEVVQGATMNGASPPALPGEAPQAIAPPPNTPNMNPQEVPGRAPVAGEVQ
jgi:hypothetical protein